MSEDMVVLHMTHGEASALSYMVAYAALIHTQGDRELTPHEDALVTKVSKLDPDGYRVWQESVWKAHREVEA